MRPSVSYPVSEHYITLYMEENLGFENWGKCTFKGKGSLDFDFHFESKYYYFKKV